MNRCVLGGIAGAVVGVGAYLAFIPTPMPSTLISPVELPAHAAPAFQEVAASPNLLPHVVEITDLDPLLDPPTRTGAGVPFEAEDKPAAPLKTQPFPDRIPPAEDAKDK